jgi:galactokinase
MYNTRVDECRLAAKKLSRFAGNSPAKVLSDVDLDVFTRFGDKLEPHIFKRAKHFISESQRVAQGLDVWERGLIEEFERLMNASCKSSIEQYECGVQAIHDLQQIVS